MYPVEPGQGGGFAVRPFVVSRFSPADEQCSLRQWASMLLIVAGERARTK